MFNNPYNPLSQGCKLIVPVEVFVCRNGNESCRVSTFEYGAEFMHNSLAHSLQAIGAGAYLSCVMHDSRVQGEFRFEFRPSEINRVVCNGPCLELYGRLDQSIYREFFLSIPAIPFRYYDVDGRECRWSAVLHVRNSPVGNGWESDDATVDLRKRILRDQFLQAARELASLNGLYDHCIHPISSSGGKMISVI